MKVTKQILWKTSWRLILAWLLLSACILFQGERLTRPLLPFVSYVISMIQSDYRAILKINSDEPGLIQMQATTRRSIPSIIAAEERLITGTHITHALVPLMIFFSILWSWPVENYQKRVVLLLLGVPLSFSIVALTVPFQLSGNVELLFQHFAEYYKVKKESTFILSWFIFLEVGGRWLLPIVLAVISCLLVQKIGSKKKGVPALKKKQKKKQKKKRNR